MANVLTAQIEIVNTQEIERRLKQLKERICSDEVCEPDKAARTASPISPIRVLASPGGRFN